MVVIVEAGVEMGVGVGMDDLDIRNGITGEDFEGGYDWGGCGIWGVVGWLGGHFALFYFILFNPFVFFFFFFVALLLNPIHDVSH